MISSVSRLVCMAGALAAAPAIAGDTFRLTVLHNNDGESKLVNAGVGLENFGGVARFKTVVDSLKAAGSAEGEVLMLSSGDNFLAGPAFNASLTNGVPFYDTIAMELIGYDAVCIGNHEFDFGPGVLADFIGGFAMPVPWLSANLEVSGEPELQSLAASGRIASSAVIAFGAERVGVVGATTPRLPEISSPGGVTVNPDVRAAVQAEVDDLISQGVNKIILISHLQSIAEDLLLIPQLRGVDIAIAGGGDNLLANPGDLLVPGETAEGPYPTLVNDADMASVPVITTAGDYKYVGRLIVDFDASGNVVMVDDRSGPVRVAGGALPDAVTPDPVVQSVVVDPVVAAINALAMNVIGTNDVPLDGRRAFIRGVETNLGNLATDALLWQAGELAGKFKVPAPQVALQNGGGIRNNNIIPAGTLTELTTFDILPFANFVSVFPAVPADRLKGVLENAVSRVEFGDGRFAQVSGLRFTWDTACPAQNRVKHVELSDGTVLVRNGTVVEGAPSVSLATIDFLARGGDGYPFAGLAFTNLGVTYQQSLRNYIETGLMGVVSGGAYPAGGERRIVRRATGADWNTDNTLNSNDFFEFLIDFFAGDADYEGDGDTDSADFFSFLQDFLAPSCE